MYLVEEHVLLIIHKEENASCRCSIVGNADNFSSCDEYNLANFFK